MEHEVRLEHDKQPGAQAAATWLPPTLTVKYDEETEDERHTPFETA